MDAWDPQSVARPRRIAVLARSGPLPDWQERCIAELATVDDLETARVAPTELGHATADVVLDLTDDGSAGCAPSPPLGIWRFEFPHPADNLVRGDLWIDARLTCRLPGRREAVVLREGRFPYVWIAPEERETIAPSRCASWPALVLSAGLEPAALHSRAPHTALGPSRASTLAVRLHAAREAIAYFLKSRASVALFNVGIVVQSLDELMDSGGEVDVRWLPEPPSDVFVADCWYGLLDDQRRLLVEWCDMMARKATIREIDVEASFARGALVSSDVVARETHVSYPQIVRAGGVDYLALENCQEEHVPLYRRQGNTWVPSSSILAELPAVDPTFLQHDGRYWLFCTLGDRPQTELLIFHAPDLFGPWTPHRGNPVKQDVTSARPGGNFFWHGGALYRPAQDGSRHYGYGVAVCRVHTLTPTRYEEEVVFRMYPEPGSRCAHGGYHTLAVADGTIAIDGFRWATSPLELGVKLRRFFERRRRNRRPSS